MKEHYLDANDIQVYVREYEKNGDPIIFLHRMRGMLEQWDAVIDYFIPNYHVITMDVRGHGKSSQPDNGYLLKDMAKDLLEVMNQLKIESAHLVGSSLGGELGVVFASMNPSRVKSLVCEGAILNFFGELGFYHLPKEEVEEKKTMLIESWINREFPAFDTKEALIEDVKNTYEKANIKWNEHFQAYAEADIKENEDGLFTYVVTSQVSCQVNRGYLDLDFEEYFKEVSCPVLFMPSEDEMKDEVVSKAINRFKINLPYSETHVIPDSSHAMVMLSHPKSFSETVLQFLHTIKTK